MKSIIENTIVRPLKKFYHIAESVFWSVRLGFPSKGLKLIAVTGTSGKSTTAIMIYHVLKQNGFKVGLISTVEAIVGEDKLDTGFHVTTPDAADLQKILHKMKTAGMEYVVIESSSHSIAQGRLGLLKIDFSVFTNIKSDHLDWHGNWNNYAKAKAGLINKLKPNGHLILNRDDKVSYDFLRSYYYSLAKDSKLFVEYSRIAEINQFNQSTNGLGFLYKNTEFSIPIIGEYNLENVLATVKVAEILNIPLDKISVSLKSFNGISGRMEVIQKTPFLVIIDFAHNGDSLDRSLKSIKEIKDIKNIITVLGSAGLRDVNKRAEMGEIAANHSKFIIVTSEDPRTESLFDINSAIISGAEKSGATLVKRFSDSKEYQRFLKEFSKSSLKAESKYIFVFDQESIDSRFDAVDFAIRLADKSDVVITQGKGHEKSLCFGVTEYPFSDHEAVQRALDSLSKN